MSTMCRSETVNQIITARRYNRKNRSITSLLRPWHRKVKQQVRAVPSRTHMFKNYRSRLWRATPTDCNRSEKVRVWAMPSA